MNTPTPRTDSAWAKTFEDDENQCRAGNAASDMRDECAKIERELAALTAERDQLRAEVHRLKKQAVFDADHVHALNLGFATRAEVERSDALYQRACEVEQELRAEVKRMTHAYEYDHKCLYEVRDRCHLWKQRAEKAEAELAAAKERLRSEAMDDYASIKDLQRELATEREKAERYRLVTLKQDAELAAERARLDSGTILLTVAGERVWHCGVDLRAAIDAGIKEGEK